MGDGADSRRAGLTTEATRYACQALDPSDAAKESFAELCDTVPEVRSGQWGDCRSEVVSC